MGHFLDSVVALLTFAGVAAVDSGPKRPTGGFLFVFLSSVDLRPRCSKQLVDWRVLHKHVCHVTAVGA